MSVHQFPPAANGSNRWANEISPGGTDHDLARHTLAWCEVQEGRCPHELLDRLLRETSTSFGIPDDANLGWLLSQCQRSGEALNRLAKELDERPDSEDLAVFAGIALQRTRDFGTSSRVLAEVLMKNPKNRLARQFHANALMNQGRWDEGFLQMENARGDLTPLQREFCRDISKLWIGQDIKGKDLVIVGNQRLSDQIQFSRYVKELRKFGAKKIGFVCDSSLVELMRSLEGINRVDSKIFYPFDYFIPVESLVMRLGTTADSIPNESPHLFCNQQKVASLKETLAHDRPLLGICWRNHQIEDRGAASQLYDQMAGSLDLELLKWHLKTLSHHFDIFSFQEDLRLDERDLLAGYGVKIIENKEFNDYERIAELLSCMEKVITVDSPIAHLAGSLGRAAQVLLPFVPDWKWSVKGRISRWYPHLEIHEKCSEDSWNKTLTQTLGGLVK